MEKAQQQGLEVREIRDIYDAYNFLTGKTLPRLQPLPEDDLEPSPEMRKQLSAKALDWKARFQATLSGVLRKLVETMRDLVQGNEARKRFLVSVKSNLQRADEKSKNAEAHERSGLFALALLEYIEALGILNGNDQSLDFLRAAFSRDLDGVKSVVQSAQSGVSRIEAMGEEMTVKARKGSIPGRVNAIAALGDEAEKLDALLDYWHATFFARLALQFGQS